MIIRLKVMASSNTAVPPSGTLHLSLEAHRVQNIRAGEVNLAKQYGVASITRNTYVTDEGSAAH
jgi:hypothetical protein